MKKVSSEDVQIIIWNLAALFETEEEKHHAEKTIEAINSIHERLSILDITIEEEEDADGGQPDRKS